jgi:hypothetical protein
MTRNLSEEEAGNRVVKWPISRKRCVIELEQSSSEYENARKGNTEVAP